MAVLLLAACWCLLALHQSVATIPDIEAIPPQIASGLTKSLTVNCNFTFGSPSNFSGLLSLIISKNDGLNDSAETFQELVSLNAFNADKVNRLSNVTATVSGHIALNSDSFLSLHWPYPSISEEGQYRCSAHVVDNTGHPADISTTVKVTVNTPDLQQLTEAIRVIQSELDYQIEKVDQLETILEKQKMKRSGMEAAIFVTSSDYNGHYYLLSRQSCRRADVAEALCEQHGGYLAEVDSYSEYDFIKRFISSSGINVNIVLLGATDEAHESLWKNRFSGKRMTFTRWGLNQPDKGDEDCVVLYKQDDWRMHDYPCYSTTDELNHYLCEIPKD